MERYRIHVAGCTEQEILTYCRNTLDSCSIQRQTGIWHGVPEESFVIELLKEKTFLIPVMAICIELKEKFRQEAVIYTAETIRGEVC